MMPVNLTLIVSLLVVVVAYVRMPAEGSRVSPTCHLEPKFVSLWNLARALFAPSS